MITKTETNITPTIKLRHYTGMTRFQGCQCYKDCSCHEDFKPLPVDYYTVTHLKLSGKRPKSKTTYHDTMEQVQERIEFLLKI
jgi:hypothetical protein